MNMTLKLTYGSSPKPKPKNPRQRRSKIWDLLTVFFDCRGIVYFEFPRPSQNKEWLLSVLALEGRCLPKETRILVKQLMVSSTRQKSSSHNSWYATPWPKNHLYRSSCSEYLTWFLVTCSFFHDLQKELKAIPKSPYEKCCEDWRKRWNIAWSGGLLFREKMITFWSLYMLLTW